MAGIGFELKKLFQKKGVLNTAKAYGYATVICAGPMLLGILLLLGIMALCSVFEITVPTRELLVSMITYTLLASVLVTSFLSMVVTRYVADMLFEDHKQAVLPAFWGSTVIMMVVGSVLWAIFLIFSGATIPQGALMFMLFNELIIVWNAMSFLTAVKDYKSIFTSFITAVAVTVLLGVLLLYLAVPAVEGILCAVSVGYGVMVVWHVILLHRYFPHTDLGAFTFLHWIDEFLPLALSGLFMNVGMFSHLVILWFSEIGVQVHGLFFGAPWHDVPALIAFLTALMTTVNFVVSVEVNFYPKYRNHYSLYNDKGTIGDIKQSEREMLDTLKTEVFYTALKQLLFTAVCIALGGYLLDMLPLGFNEVMRGYFRTLCVAYGLYAIGNMLMLILMYFTDYKGACMVSAIFAGGTILLTLISMLFPAVYYGMGFLLASMVFVVVTAFRLDYFTKRLPYYILAAQPLVAEDRSGLFTRMGVFLENHLENHIHNGLERSTSDVEE